MWSSRLGGRTNGHETSAHIKNKEIMASWRSSGDTSAEETSSRGSAVHSPELLLCHQTAVRSDTALLLGGARWGNGPCGWVGVEEAQGRREGVVCWLPAFRSTVAFVGIHWRLREPPSLCKLVFASQVFVQPSAAFIFFLPPHLHSQPPRSLEPKGQSGIDEGNNAHIKSGD